MDRLEFATIYGIDDKILFKDRQKVIIDNATQTVYVIFASVTLEYIKNLNGTIEKE